MPELLRRIVHSRSSANVELFCILWRARGSLWELRIVRVHDLAAVAKGPLMYAVYRISNMTEMPCKSLEGVPLRAILSWQHSLGFSFIPTWGNVINMHVQPIVGVVTGETSRLMRIGGVTINRISDITHLAYPRAIGTRHTDCLCLQATVAATIALWQVC